MIGIRAKLQNFKLRRYLHKKSNKLKVPNDIQLRLPQYCNIMRDAVLGKNCRLMCWDAYNGKPTGNKPEICIGKNFHATRGLSIQCANKVIIGNNVLIASNVTFIDYNHGINPQSSNYLDNPLDISSGIIVEDGVWIGDNCLLLGGITIGKKSIVGGGSVVTHSVPPYTMVAGNPAKIIKIFDLHSSEWTRVNESSE